MRKRKMYLSVEDIAELFGLSVSFGLAAEAVGKEDNYAENTGYVYQYGRSGRGCL